MNEWDSRFKNADYAYGKEANKFIREIYNQLQYQGKTLAIAEGEGRNGIFLAEKRFDVTTWDYSGEGIKKTEALAFEKQVRVKSELVDLNTAPWKKNTWDNIVNVYGHFDSSLRKKTLHSVKDAIKPGGYYISEVYSTYQIPYNSGGPKNLDMLYDPAELFQSFKDWKIVHFFLGEVQRHEGNFHNGLAHVIQICAQKPT